MASRYDFLFVKDPTERRALRIEETIAAPLKKAVLYPCGCDPRMRAPVGPVIYFIQEADNKNGPIKIGHTRDIIGRLAALQTGSPVPLIVLATTPGDERAERRMHLKFAKLRLHGEWFTPDIMLQLQAMVFANPARSCFGSIAHHASVKSSIES